MESGNKKNTGHERSAGWIVFFSTFMLVQIGIFDLFFILQSLFLVYLFLVRKKISIIKDRVVLYTYMVWILSTFFCLFSNIPLSYKKNSIIAIGSLLLVFLSVSQYEKYTYSREFMRIIRKAIVTTCTLQVLWCIVQLFLYRCFEIDLNREIFCNLLRLVEEPSQYKVGVYHPSGMCWHSVFIAPIAILLFTLSDSIVSKGLAFFAAIVCNNATAMIGIFVCIGFTVLISVMDVIKKSHRTVKQRTIVLGVLLIIVSFAILFFTSIGTSVLKRIVEIYYRASGIANDDSSFAHMRYYSAISQIIDDESIIQFLFGYGTSNSGYPFSKIFGQYVDVKSWVVESDIMNQFYSGGLLGFFSFYIILFYIALKGYKVDRRYSIVALSFIVSGITYNIQFNWVIYIEMLFYFFVKNKVPFNEEL